MTKQKHCCVGSNARSSLCSRKTNCTSEDKMAGQLLHWIGESGHSQISFLFSRVFVDTVFKPAARRQPRVWSSSLQRFQYVFLKAPRLIDAGVLRGLYPNERNFWFLQIKFFESVMHSYSSVHGCVTVTLVDQTVSSSASNCKSCSSRSFGKTLRADVNCAHFRNFMCVFGNNGPLQGESKSGDQTFCLTWTAAL